MNICIGKTVRFQRRMPGEMTKRCLSYITRQNVKHNIWMSPSFSPRPEIPSKAIAFDKIILVKLSQRLLSFSHFHDICRTPLKVLPNMLKFIRNHQVNLFQWRNFDCRSIFKLLESIPIGTESIAISRNYYWYIFAKFILTFKIFSIYISIVVREIHFWKLKWIGNILLAKENVDKFSYTGCWTPIFKEK